MEFEQEGEPQCFSPTVEVGALAPEPEEPEQQKEEAAEQRFRPKAVRVAMVRLRVPSLNVSIVCLHVYAI